MSKETILKVALAICIVVILALVLVNYVDLDKKDNRYPVNDGLTSLIEFDVDCPEVGSSTKGTFFVMQSEDSVKVKIVADLIVGVTDLGGIEFAITRELDVASVLCSFNDDVSTEYVTILKSPERHHIEIARTHYYGTPFGGGQGTAIIELELNESVNLSDIDSLGLYIAVGGKDNILGLVGERMAIPILHNIAE